MTTPFRSVAEAQAFASAFSKATASAEGSPKLSLNSTLHCLAVAAKFKNWPTMKVHLAALEADLAKGCVPNIDPPVQIKKHENDDPWGYVGSTQDPRHFVYSSPSPESRLAASVQFVRAALARNFDVVVLSMKPSNHGHFGLDKYSLSLDVDPVNLLNTEFPVSLGFNLDTISPEVSAGHFLKRLCDFQQSRKNTGSNRGLHLIFSDLNEFRSPVESKYEDFFAQVSAISREGRSFGISSGHVFARYPKNPCVTLQNFFSTINQNCAWVIYQD